MKFSKKLLAICSTILLLSGCGDYTVPPVMGNGGDGGNKAPEQSNEQGGNTPDKPKTPIDTYLVLSSVGLYKGEKGKSIEDKMLENAIIYNALPGENLPTKDDITTIDGSKGEFDGWVCYEGTGFPTIYETVPNVAGMILYATFKNGEGSSGGGGQGSGTITPNQKTTIYLDATQKLNADNDETWASGNAAITMHVWSFTTGDNEMILMNNLNNGFYSGDVDLGKYTNVIFLRHASGSTASFEEGGYWNKTGDLLFIDGKNCFKITDWNNGGYWTNK
ncbi:MAG: hypothetical protein K6E21_05335 [Bacilli bacterium]|nr:hypothetical protein [Bacilli bacterium]